MNQHPRSSEHRWPKWQQLVLVILLAIPVTVWLSSRLVPLWEENDSVDISFTPAHVDTPQEVIATELLQRWLTYFEGRWYVNRITGFTIDEVTVHRSEDGYFLFWATYSVEPASSPFPGEREAHKLQEETVTYDGEFRANLSGNTYYLRVLMAEPVQ